MGSSGSKTARAAGSAARQYPSRTASAPPPPSTTTASAPQRPTTNAPRQQPPPAQGGRAGPTVRPQARASAERDEAINLDASDPDFAASLRRLGAVQPNPTLSPSSAFPTPQNTHNPAYPSSLPGNSARPGGHHLSARQYPAFPDPRQNPALLVLDARSRLQDAADREFLDAGRRGFPGREFLDVGVVRQVLAMRERGLREADIESTLGLRPGLVGHLGPRGVVATLGED